MLFNGFFRAAARGEVYWKMTDSDIIAFIIDIWKLVEYLLPAVITVFMTVTVWKLIREERASRKLSQMRSPEWQMVQSLVEAKAISREEGDVLLLNSAGDEERNRFAVPDIQLKIVSVFGRIFSVLKFTYLLIRLVIVSVVTFWLPFDLKTSANPELSILIIAAGLTWALVEYAASVNILQKSVWSRRFLIFSWIANMVLARGIFSDINTIFFYIPPICGGIYTLYVLVLRRDAGKYTAHDEPGISLPRKIAFVLIMLAAIGWGVCYSKPYSARSMVNDLKVSHGNWTSVRTREIILVEGSRDRETRQFCRLLAEAVREELGIPCRVLGEERSPKLELQNGLLTLLIMRTKVISPSTPWNGLSAGPASSDYDLLKKLAQRRNLLAFRITTLDDDNFGLSSYKGLRIMTANAALGGVITGEASFADTSGTLKGMVPVVLSRIREAAMPREGQPALDLPDIRLRNATKLPPLPGSLPEPELIYLSHSIRLNTLAVYRFKIRDAESLLKYLVREMEAMGYLLFQTGKQDGRLVFHGKDFRQKYIFEIRETGAGRINSQGHYGSLVYLDSKPRNDTPGKNFLNRFLADDPRSFALAWGLNILSGEEFRRAFEKVSRLDNLMLPEKLAVLRIAPYQREEAGGFERYREFYRLTVDELMADSGAYEFMGRVGEMLQTGRLVGLEDYLLEKLRPFRVRVKYPAGKDRFRFEIEQKPLTGSRVICEVAMPGGSSIVIPMAVTALKGKGYHFHSSSVELDFIDGGMISGGVWFDGERWLPAPVPARPEDAPPGSVYYTTRFNPADSQYIVDMYWKDGPK
jgi:hypothetical protein